MNVAHNARDGPESSLEYLSTCPCATLILRRTIMKRPKEALQPDFLMNRVPRTSLLVIAVLAALPVAPVRGAALGELSARSALGAPLNAEIRITPAPGEQIDGQCIRIVRGQTDDLPWLAGARVRLEGERLIITTRDPVNHPAAMLGVHIGCGIELRRDYALLLQPPLESPAVTAAVVTPDAPAPARAPSTPPAAARPRPVGQVIVLSEDTPLARLADERAGSSPARRQRFIERLVMANPDVFPSGRADEGLVIAAGTRLKTTPPALPAHHADTPPRRADTVARAQAAPAAPTSPAQATRPSTRHEPAPRQDRLVVAGTAGADDMPLRLSLQLANPPRDDAPGDAVRGPIRQEQRTLTEIDDRITAQLELNEKIKRLEEYQELLKRKIADLDAGPPGQAAPTAAPPPAPAPAAAPRVSTPAAVAPPESAAEGLPAWALPAGAGLVTLLLGGGALVWWRRRNLVVPEDSLEPISVGAESTTGLHAETPPVFVTTMGPPSILIPSPAAAPAPQSAMPVREMPALDIDLAPKGDWSEPTFAPTHSVPFDEAVDEQDSALELAEIMMSFGRTQGAAETLADYIRNNPRQAVKPWIKLLEVYHLAGMRAEFEALTRQLNKTFNVKMVSWHDYRAPETAPDSVEQLPHIVRRLEETWNTAEAQAYIHQILRDNRDGTRQGFPLGVVDDLLMLLAVLDDHLGPYRQAAETPDNAPAPADTHKAAA